MNTPFLDTISFEIEDNSIITLTKTKGGGSQIAGIHESHKHKALRNRGKCGIVQVRCGVVWTGDVVWGLVRHGGQWMMGACI